MTERDSGRVLHISDGRVAQVGDVDETRAQGEAGLLGIAVSPSYAKNRAVFAYVTTDQDRPRGPDDVRGQPAVGAEADPHRHPERFHPRRRRLQFAPDGNLFVSTGETGNGFWPRTRTRWAARSCGSPSAASRPRATPTRARRSGPSATATCRGWPSTTGGHLWASEFGANTFDELNLIQKGNNYGWPEVEGKGDQDRYRNPQVVWSTDQASPSGLAFLDGHLWLGALRGSRVWRIDVEGQRAREPTDFFVGKYGPIRTVVAAPDGNLWVTTSNRDGRGNRFRRTTGSCW